MTFSARSPAAVRDEVGLDEAGRGIVPIAEGPHRHAAPQAVQPRASAPALAG